jgi:peptide deformylase
VDRVRDPTTLSTWEQYERWHRAAFVERITAFVDRIGS